jgi:hypothetical protein
MAVLSSLQQVFRMWSGDSADTLGFAREQQGLGVSPREVRGARP